MAGDGILSIGATVDKTGVEAGLSSIQEGVQSTVQTIAVQVEETCARTKAAWNKLGDDVKAASQSVSAESLKVAEATKAQTIALADLRRASILSKDAKLDEATQTAILAAAQQKLAATSAEIAAAKREEAAAVAEAAEEEGLSSNFIIAAFQRAALSVREACTEMQEKFVETAETAKISGEGMTAGFGTLGALLGGGIAVGFATHFIDEVAKTNVELGHLEEKTGISVNSLAALRQIVKESGGDFEAVSTGLVRMVRAQEQVIEGNKKTAKAFTDLGISEAQVKAASPQQLLEMVAAAMGRTESAAIRANSAITILGRGGAALIPVLRQQGDQLGTNITNTAKLTGVTDESVAASERWTRNMAKLTEAFQRFGNFAIENMHFVGAAFDAIGALVRTVFEGIATGIVAVAVEMGSFGKLVGDIVTGNFKAFGDDVHAVMYSAVDVAVAGGKEIASAWKSVGDMWKSTPAGKAAREGGGADDENGPAGAGPAGAGGKGGGAAAGGGAQGNELATQTPDTAATIPEQTADWASFYKSVSDEAFALADMQKRIDAANVANDAATQAQQLAQWTKYYLGITNAAMASQRVVQDNFKKMFTAMTGPMNTFFDHWLTSGKNMGQAFQKMVDQMAMNFINAAIKMLEKHLETEIQKRLITQTTSTLQVASTASATAVTGALESQSAMQSLSKSAATAAGKAWSALSGIPIVGPALGAIAAAGTYAGIMSLAVFDQGGMMLPGNVGINKSGRPERVLDPVQTERFEQMVNQSTSTSASTQELHFHDHSSFHGIDGASVAGMYRQHAAAGRREMTRQLRLANRI